MERKGTGQFYTPSDIVQYIISHLPIKSDSKILDPACGCGSFLLGLFDTLRIKYGVSALKNLYGVDLNPDAINITRFSLFVKSGCNKKYLKPLRENIRFGNSIVTNTSFDKNGFNWNDNFASVMSDGGFDYVVGNPPYVTLDHNQFDLSETNYSNIINGSTNAASLMIMRSISLLKKDGMLAFLLPKSILYVHSYDLLRKFILDNARILQIFDLGQKFPDVRGEQIILILQKRKPRINDEQTLIKILKNKDKPLFEQPSFKIKHNLLNTINNFLALDSATYYKIIKNLKDENQTLGDLVDEKIFRGIPIGANSPKISKTP
ncbi:MAG: N-6 DNA methylase, partial [Candidatus Nitrosotenuis sp.]